MVTLITLLSIGCEPYQAIAYKNGTTLPVKAILYSVSLDYTGTPNRTWNDPGTMLNAGESKTLVTGVSNKRAGGIGYKYIAIAITETNEVIFSKIYTWDELHNANWKVVITTQH
jgi:hypothetical protein